MKNQENYRERRVKQMEKKKKQTTRKGDQKKGKSVTKEGKNGAEGKADTGSQGILSKFSSRTHPKIHEQVPVPADGAGVPHVLPPALREKGMGPVPVTPSPSQ